MKIMGLEKIRMARAGRKRKPDVVRFPCGQPVDLSVEAPFNLENVVQRGDGRLGNIKGYQRMTILEQLNLSRSQRLAGEEFARLCERCRRYSWDSPSIEPKVSSPMGGGHSHDSELSDEIIDLGKRVHRKYLAAIRAMRTRAMRGATPAVVAICVENKMPTCEQRRPLRSGLDALANLWGY